MKHKDQIETKAPQPKPKPKPLTGPEKDTRILDWLEQQADHLSITRDHPRGSRVSLSYRTQRSGPSVIAFASTLREAALGGIKDAAEASGRKPE